MSQYYDRDQKKYIWVSPEHPLPTQPKPSDALVSGTIAATGTAAELDDDQAVRWVIITNTGGDEDENLLVGNDTAQVFPVAPGQSLRLEVANLNLVYAKAASESASGAYIAGS